MQDLTRQELKLIAAPWMLPNVRTWIRLNGVGFYSPYPKRQVNNIYFDTPHLDSWAENLSGVTSRRKVRLRWYGEDAASVLGVLEIKCKRNKRSWKLSQSLSKPLDLTSSGWPDIVQIIHRELKEDLCRYFDFANSPVLINQYCREYYVSFDETVRVTLDYSPMLYDQRHTQRPNLHFSTPNIRDMVIEFKANPEHSEYLQELLQDIPLRISRSSKYSRGIAALMNY
jgi:hypothetical protein